MIKLTKRLEEICKLVAQGLGDSEIAGITGITLATVKLHVWRARQIFGVKNRTALAIKYLDDRGAIDWKKFQKTICNL